MTETTDQKHDAVNELRQSLDMTSAIKKLSDRVYTLTDEVSSRFSFVEQACESRYHDNETLAKQVADLKTDLKTSDETLAENVSCYLRKTADENKALTEKLEVLQKERAGDRVLIGALMERLDRLEGKYGEQNRLLNCVTREVEVLIDAVPQVEEETQESFAAARSAAKRDNDRLKARLDLYAFHQSLRCLSK